MVLASSKTAQAARLSILVSKSRSNKAVIIYGCLVFYLLERCKARYRAHVPRHASLCMRMHVQSIFGEIRKARYRAQRPRHASLRLHQN
jgi:uncharacterized membrane protein